MHVPYGAAVLRQLKGPSQSADSSPFAGLQVIVRNFLSVDLGTIRTRREILVRNTFSARRSKTVAAWTVGYKRCLFKLLWVIQVYKIYCVGVKYSCRTHRAVLSRSRFRGPRFSGRIDPTRDRQVIKEKSARTRTSVGLFWQVRSIFSQNRNFANQPLNWSWKRHQCLLSLVSRLMYSLYSRIDLTFITFKFHFHVGAFEKWIYHRLWFSLKIIVSQSIT